MAALPFAGGLLRCFGAPVTSPALLDFHQVPASRALTHCAAGGGVLSYRLVAGTCHPRFLAWPPSGSGAATPSSDISPPRDIRSGGKHSAPLEPAAAVSSRPTA